MLRLRLCLRNAPLQTFRTYARGSGNRKTVWYKHSKQAHSKKGFLGRCRHNMLVPLAIGSTVVYAIWRYRKVRDEVMAGAPEVVQSPTIPKAAATISVPLTPIQSSLGTPPSPTPVAAPDSTSATHRQCHTQFPDGKPNKECGSSARRTPVSAPEERTSIPVNHQIAGSSQTHQPIPICVHPSPMHAQPVDAPPCKPSREVIPVMHRPRCQGAPVPSAEHIPVTPRCNRGHSPNDGHGIPITRRECPAQRSCSPTKEEHQIPITRNSSAPHTAKDCHNIPITRRAIHEAPQQAIEGKPVTSAVVAKNIEIPASNNTVATPSTVERLPEQIPVQQPLTEPNTDVRKEEEGKHRVSCRQTKQVPVASGGVPNSSGIDGAAPPSTVKTKRFCQADTPQHLARASEQKAKPSEQVCAQKEGWGTAGQVMRFYLSVAVGAAVGQIVIGILTRKGS